MKHTYTAYVKSTQWLKADLEATDHLEAHLIAKDLSSDEFTEHGEPEWHVHRVERLATLAAETPLGQDFNPKPDGWTMDNVSEMVKGYLETALFADAPEHWQPKSVSDANDQTRHEAWVHCTEFLRAITLPDTLTAEWMRQLGSDLFYARQGHSVGFHDHTERYTEEQMDQYSTEAGKFDALTIYADGQTWGLE